MKPVIHSIHERHRWCLSISIFYGSLAGLFRLPQPMIVLYPEKQKINEELVLSPPRFLTFSLDLTGDVVYNDAV